ncbi:MAG: hypothetical protein KF770_31030, partial [Anaerolineae bacterium]|nr:hypothetical protein [Anaerolineae bacterium]
LLIVDPSGHCWGFAGFLRNTFYSTTCNNLDMAVSIVQHPDASVGQKVAAGAYIVGEAAAHTVAVAGSVVAGVGCLTGAGTAICAAGGTAVTAVSADGDPTNEVAAAANVIQSVTADGDPTNEAQVLLRTVGNAQSAAMNVVRNIEKGERVGQLLDELKTLTFTTGNEHAIVRMSDGTRAMVSGGQGGINLTSEVSKVIIHTHPYQLPGTGMASPYDYQMLHQLGQFSSRILEHGNLIKFTIAD